MRLWHQSLLPYLNRQHILGQHRECCALRGAGWGRKHSVVDYVFTHDPAYLVSYHYKVMDEMRRRGYNPNSIWEKWNWRGETLGIGENFVDTSILNQLQYADIVFPEHDDTYLKECISLLESKGYEHIREDIQNAATL